MVGVFTPQCNRSQGEERRFGSLSSETELITQCHCVSVAWR